MAQPTAYVPATNFADDERANTGGRSTVRTDRLDAELAALELTIGQIRANLAVLQRDDGKLNDGFVELYNLSASCRAALVTNWNPRGLWATSTAYAVGDMVDVSGASYICATAHTSGVFATDYAGGKWQIFVPASSAGGVTFTPTTTISASTVQGAIEEVDGELRAGSTPTLASFFGAL